MDKIENLQQFEEAVQRVEELLPLINDDMPTGDPNYIEFENIDTMFLKDDVTPSIIENTRIIKTSLTESVKYSPINNELIAD